MTDEDIQPEEAVAAPAPSIDPDTAMLGDLAKQEAEMTNYLEMLKASGYYNGGELQSAENALTKGFSRLRRALENGRA